MIQLPCGYSSYHDYRLYFVVDYRDASCRVLFRGQGGACPLLTNFHLLKLGLYVQSGIKEKSSETREYLKSGETREVAYTCRYTSEHLIPNSVMGIYSSITENIQH